MPRVLRFIPLLMHREFGWPFPALIAGIQDVRVEFAGVQVTGLAADGRDKAPVEVARKTFGPARGGAVRLAPAGEVLVLAEGIETALSVQQATDLPTWAVLGTSNLVSVALPPGVREVIICADNDEPGVKAARSAAMRFYSEGRNVRIAYPSAGKDFNDLLRASA
jgi:hypothetical protein